MDGSSEILCIKDARLTDPSQGVDDARDVLVADGTVKEVALRLSPPPGATVVDASGLWLWPGLVDVHVHFREPGFTDKETIRSGSRAAAAGGYTSVVCEPNTVPPIDSPEVAARIERQAQTDAVVNVYVKAAITRGRRGRELGDLEELARQRNVVAFSDDGDPLVGRKLMEEACRAACRLGVLLSPHCEDSQRATEMFGEGVDPGFEPGSPYTNESAYIQRDLQIAGEHGCRIHFSHVSLARSVEVIREFRSTHDPDHRITFEVAPHHFVLSRDAFPADELPAVTPPLRSEQDREALVEALTSGMVDVIASDHAPHTPEAVAGGATGLIGLETTLGVVLTRFVHTGAVSPLRAVELLSTSPARIFGLPAGSLQPGAAADMVLIDPRREWTVDAGSFRSKSRNTPFQGWELRGKTVATLRAGKETYSEPELSTRISRYRGGESTS